MFPTVSYVMVNVSDMARSVAFYRDVLGMKLRFESPGWSEFDTGATTLALHGAGSPPQGPGKGPNPAGSCSIGFSVTDLDATHATLKDRGVRFVMPPTLQEKEGIRLAVALDPDGLPVSFAQRLT